MDKRYSDFVETLEKIISEYDDSSNKYEEVKTFLTIVKKKLADNTLYLGAVGSFSSGKSTFLNSMIQKNLLPTDAVQGTTVSATILKKAKTNDLIIHYCDGQILSYTNDTDKVAAKYGFEIKKEKLIIWQKFISWLKRLFRISRVKEQDNSQMKKLFLDLISNENNAKDIKQVVLNIKNDNIPYDIGFVDTPGTESLNSRHNEVTKNAIENICDAIVIIIPYDKPVSEELLNYINGNIREYIDNCIFVVTKVELLDDIEELPRLMKVIKKRLENGLDISNPIVLPMPTLLYLKNVDPDVKITLLDDMEEAQKIELLELYNQGYTEIYNVLNNNREQFLRNKLISVCEQVSKKLILSLQEKVQEHDEINSELVKKKVVELSDFRETIIPILNDEINHMIVLLEANKVNIHFEYSRFAANIEDGIANKQELDTIASSISEIETNNAINETKKILKAQLIEIRKRENKICKQISEKFVQQYESCGSLNLSSSVLTTFNCSILDGYVSEAEGGFKEMRDNIVIHIRNQSAGFVNKFKFLFSKNVKKEKEYTISLLHSYLSTEEEQTISFVDKWNKNIEIQMQKQLLDFLDKLINSNSALISQYSEANIISIKRNQSLKEKTETNISKIEGYLKILRED